MEADTSINRTLSYVPNATFVCLTTSEMRIPHSLIWLNDVLIREVPLYRDRSNTYAYIQYTKIVY